MICFDCRRALALEGLTMCLACKGRLDDRRKRAPEEVRTLERLRKLAAGVAGWFLVLGVWCEGVSAGEALPEEAIVPLQVLAPTCAGSTCRLQPVSRGSAVCIARRGGKVVMLTARHCLPDSPQEVMQVYLRGIWVKARGEWHSKLNADVALILAEADDCEQMAHLGPSRPAVGDTVTLTGYTHGLTYQAIQGTVSPGPADERSAGLYDWASLPQQRYEGNVFGGSVVEGQSGGGVFDRSGDLVGILTNRGVDAPWMGRYVAVDELRRMLISVGLHPSERDDPPEASPESGPRSAPARPVPVSPLPNVTPPDDQRGIGDDPLLWPVDPLPVSPPAVVPPVVVPPLPPPKKSLTTLPVTERDSLESQGKRPPVATGGTERNGGFWSSLIPLGMAVAGTAATGGVGWFTLIRPTLNTVRAAVEEIQPHRLPPPSGCFPAPPVPQNVVVTNETLANPGAVVTQTHVAPVQIDRVSEALSIAFQETLRRYPNSAGTVEAIKSMANQVLASQGHAARI